MRDRGALSAKALSATIVLLVVALAAPAPAQQGQSFNALLDRLDRLERDLGAVQRRLAREGVSAGAPESEAAADPAMIADREMRLAGFKDQLRQLTDQLERTEFRLRQLGDSLSLTVRDLEDRVAALEAAARSASAPMAEATGDAGAPPGVAPDVAEPPDTAPAPGQPSADDVGTADAADATETAPEEAYEHAYEFLERADYVGAEAALRRFIERFPEHPLAGNAGYWLGETHYARQDYESAAVAFARSYRNFPQGGKAPDNLLKIGMSFAAMGRIEDACATFMKLREEYDDAPTTVLDRLVRESARADCP